MALFFRMCPRPWPARAAGSPSSWTAPEKHRRYALKVLVKFKLLEWQTTTKAALLAWALQTSYLTAVHARRTQR